MHVSRLKHVTSYNRLTISSHLRCNCTLVFTVVWAQKCLLWIEPHPSERSRKPGCDARTPSQRCRSNPTFYVLFTLIPNSQLASGNHTVTAPESAFNFLVFCLLEANPTRRQKNQRKCTNPLQKQGHFGKLLEATHLISLQKCSKPSEQLTDSLSRECRSIWSTTKNPEKERN